MPRSGPTTREDRLKAALKANMGRRKAQARARSDTDDATDQTPADEQKDDSENG